MISRIKNRLSFGAAILLIVSMLICQYNTLSKKDAENPYPISWDVYGYYLYLPATFIYHDLGLQNNDWIEKTRAKYNPSTTFYQVTAGKENKRVIVYNIGYSFVFAPGFFVANWMATFFGYEADGFSKPYQVVLLVTAMLLSIAGIFMFRLISLRFFSDKITALLIITVFAGTNYFFQAAYDGVMPHNILFTLNCFILWFTIKWHEEKKLKHILLLALFLGLATICRPTELIWILVPLFWNVYDKETLIQKVRFLFQHFVQVVCFGVLLAAIVFIQFAYLKYATGYFRAFNLHNESFSFLDPYTIQFLFSYKKGWLVYTPVMILAIVGFYYLKKQNKNVWLPLLLFFLVNLYVVSSWECWWYAASFSQRPMVETYAMMGLPMGYILTELLERKAIWLKYLLFCILAALVFLNQFQIQQYLSNVIDGERMTKKSYWAVFGKMNNTEDAKQYLSVDRGQTVFTEYPKYNNKYFKKEALFLDFENDSNANAVNIADSIAANGKKCFVLNDIVQFSPAFEQKYSDITSKSYVWIRASVWVYLTAPYTESNSSLVISTESKGKSYKYLNSNYDNYSIKPFEWTEIRLDYLTPEIRHKSDLIKVYFWNQGNKPVFIDDLKVEVFEPKEDYE